MDPADSAIRWTGAPAPVEGRTLGGALSPHGSHVGVKAVLDPEQGLGPMSLGAVAIHEGRATRQGRIATVSFVVETEGAPLDADDPFATFEPWGWSVSAEAGALATRTRVFFVTDDAILLTLSLESTGADPVDVVARFDVEASGAAAADGGDVLVSAGDATLALGISSDLTIREAGPPAELVVGTASITPGESTSFTVMIGFGSTPDEARSARDHGWAAFASRAPEVAWDEQAALFEATKAAAACADIEGADAETAHRLAVAALLGSAYAPRAALTRTLLSAAKSADNAFFGSDVPAQARAIATWDPALALDALLGQMDALADDSHVPYRFDDELGREPLPNGSMPPVQAQAFVDLARWGGELHPEERDRVVRRLSAVAAWWPTNRDYRYVGLLVHGSPEEAGRHGSVRWPIVDGTSEARYFEAPDLSATYAEFLESLADFSLGVADADPGLLRSRAHELRDRIDDDLWDDDLGQYVDLDTRTGERSTVTGSHGLGLLAAGGVHDEERVGRVLDDVLLRSDGLWGDEDGPRPPVPSIAYDAVGVEPSERPAYLEDMVVALRALARYGRTEDASDLEQRVVALVARYPEGAYDRYYEEGVADDAPRILQPGGAAAALLSILHRDHQRERTILSDETRIEGRIDVARFHDGGARLVDLGDLARLPRLVLESIEPVTPLEDRDALRLTLEATCDVAVGDEVEIALPALGPFRWTAEDGSGSDRSSGSFVAAVGKSYRIEALRLRGGGCSCRTGERAGGGLAEVLWLAVVVLLLASRTCRSTRPPRRCKGVEQCSRRAARATRGFLM